MATRHLGEEGIIYRPYGCRFRPRRSRAFSTACVMISPCSFCVFHKINRRRLMGFLHEGAQLFWILVRGSCSLRRFFTHGVLPDSRNGLTATLVRAQGFLPCNEYWQLKSERGSTESPASFIPRADLQVRGCGSTLGVHERAGVRTCLYNRNPRSHLEGLRASASSDYREGRFLPLARCRHCMHRCLHGPSRFQHHPTASPQAGARV